MHQKITEPHPRDRLMLSLAINDKWTQAQIGKALGNLSPQRVSQCIHHVRGHLLLHRTRLLWPETSKVISICDEAESLNDAAKKLNVGRDLLASMLRIYNLIWTYKKRWEKAAHLQALSRVALFSQQKSEREITLRRRYLCRVMRLVAKHLGHTPSMPEMRALSKETGGRIPTPHSWIMVFGTYRNGQIEAGLPPNTRGGNRYEHHAKAS